MSDVSTNNAVEPQRPPRGAPPRLGRGGRMVVVVCVVLIVLLAIVDAITIRHRRRYEAEISRLRASMSQLERRRADAILAGEKDKVRIAIELARRQARLEPALHLSVALDSNAMYLERDGALLRRMAVEIGPERRIGVAPDTVRLAIPRGVRTIAAVITDSVTSELPEWVYADRGLPLSAQRTFPGALGPVAIMLDGGTILYSLPAHGPLADSAYVMPGAVRARADDLRAIAPNLAAGTRVYFY